MPNNAYSEWLYKASEDELSVNAILKENGAPSTACFLSQQMAEKSLKGLLVFFAKITLHIKEFVFDPFYTCPRPDGVSEDMELTASPK